jgi:hypothetical protein
MLLMAVMAESTGLGSSSIRKGKVGVFVGWRPCAFIAVMFIFIAFYYELAFSHSRSVKNELCQY